MRYVSAILLFCVSLAVGAQEPSILIDGVAVSKSMSEKEFREVFPDIECRDHKIKKTCTFSFGEGWERSGSVTFEAGHVRSVVRHVRELSTEDPREVLQVITDLLVEVTGGKTTCMEANTYNRDPRTLGSDTIFFILPEKYISLTYSSHAPTAWIEEGLRVNPISRTSTTQADDHSTKDCVFYP